ncbi:molybdenum cofactor biosynthesis protein MoaE [Thermosulfidibacter takaii]|uniref:molybdenum cofactor biosynthesis protein MoaE n=1 Tax=Thermosulfidibacter takaii TaxID=412593 RepID=UPI00130E2355|nr:molybdenum cofactor biosynthesis protein MoaE [Thermosulfidibacter takaii]
MDRLIQEVTHSSDLDNLGMILIHKGIVRGKSRSGESIKALEVRCDPEKIEELEQQFSTHPGIEFVKVIVNTGKLQVGDEIMSIVVAGRFREDVIPTFQKLLELVKQNIEEKEIT